LANSFAVHDSNVINNREAIMAYYQFGGNIYMIKFIKDHRDNTYLCACIIAALFGLTLIMGCEGQPTPIDPRLVDRSFLTGQPCAAPCWYGIEPDKSPEEEALSKLNELPFVDSQSIREYKNVNTGDYSGASEIYFGCAFPQGSTCGVIVGVEGIVKEIDLTIQYPLPLKSVIDLLGTPESISYTPYPPHGDGCYVSFNWPQKRINVLSLDRPTQKLCQNIKNGMAFDPGLQISGVNYWSKEIALRGVCSQLNCISWPGFIDK
jgi:hypothetical protein